MITLCDVIEITAPPERIFYWLSHLKENYLAWHPDHVDCQYLTDGPLREGTIVYCEEYLHGKLHKLKFRATKIVPNSCIEYRLGPGMRGAFRIEPRGDQSAFIAYLYFGLTFPVIGWLADKIVLLAFSRQIVEFQRHMAEEGRNLKRIIETGEQAA